MTCACDRRHHVECRLTSNQVGDIPCMLIMIWWADSLSLRAVYTYKCPHAVPIDGCPTYQELASASGISESMVRRFLRHAMANRVFAQSSFISQGGPSHSGVATHGHRPGFLQRNRPQGCRAWPHFCEDL